MESLSSHLNIWLYFEGEKRKGKGFDHVNINLLFLSETLGTSCVLEFRVCQILEK